MASPFSFIHTHTHPSTTYLHSAIYILHENILSSYSSRQLVDGSSVELNPSLCSVVHVAVGCHPRRTVLFDVVVDGGEKKPTSVTLFLIMANYTPIAQNESSVDTLLADETFATDRDKSDAKSHHLEKDRLSKHHLVSPLVAAKHPSIMRQPSSPVPPATVPVQSNHIPIVPGQQQGSVGQQPAANNNGVAAIKPNVTFKLSDDANDRVLPVKGFFKTFNWLLHIILLFTFCLPSLPMWAMVNVTWPCVASALHIVT